MKNRLVYSGIAVITLLLVSGVTYKYQADMAQIKEAYQTEQNSEIDKVALNIEGTFKEFYQGLRTMALLPGVRSIDRYGKNFHADSKGAMQQVYNNTFLNVTLSEVYILPASLDPDRIDPQTKKPEEPILTFDEFIVGKENKKEEDEANKLEEVEIEEYRLMKNQLIDLAQKYPTNEHIDGLKYPAISGPEVITCDNSEFTPADLKSGNDAPRKGIVYTLPVFDVNGTFKGAVSGVVRTNVIRRLFPEASFGLVNRTNGWEIATKPSAEFIESKPYFEKGLPHPQAIVSQVRKLTISDSSDWALWVTLDDSKFFNRRDVHQAKTIFYAGLTFSLFLGLMMFLGARTAINSQARLEQKVREKTEEIGQRNRAMQLILSNAEQGFLSVDLQGIVSLERSSAVDKWFGPVQPQTKIWDFLGARNPAFATLLHFGWDQLVEDIFPFDVAAGQLPQKVLVDGRFIAVNYKPVYDQDNKLFRILVVLSDITNIIENERREVEQKEMLHVFQWIMKDRNGFLNFFSDARNLVKALGGDAKSSDLTMELRALHTLKGNTSQFGLISVADLCHQLETEVIDGNRTLTPQERSALRQQWELMAARLHDLIGDPDRKQITVDVKDYAKLLTLVRERSNAKDLVEHIESLAKDPLAVAFNRMKEQTVSLVQRLGKGPVNVIVDDAGIRLDGEKWNELWSQAIHMIRNSVDHGLETPEERQELHKGPPTMVFRARQQPDGLRIEISDDGRGIDWERLRESAHRKGLPHNTRQDLMDAMFADGVSTKDDVSDLSGRGVGMAAVRSAVNHLGGVIQVESERNKGTKFVMWFPAQAKAA